MHFENTRKTVENTRPSSPDFTRMQARHDSKQHQTSRMAEQQQATYHSLERQAKKELEVVRQQELTTRRGIVPQTSQETLILGIHSKLKGGTILTDKSLSEFFTEEEIHQKYQYNYNNDGSYKGVISNRMYKRVSARNKSKSSIYSEEDIIKDLNETRQGIEYKNAFGYNTLYNPNDAVAESSHQLSEDQTTQPESEDDRFRDRLLQSLAQHYTEHKNGYLDFSHFKASVYHFNYVRKTNYSTEEMVHLLHEEEYLT